MDLEMGLALIILVVLLAVAAGAFGGWLLLNLIRGGDPIVIKGEWKGVKAEGPGGAIIMLVALGVAAYLVTQYAPKVDAENKKLTADKEKLTNDYNKLDAQLRQEKARADGLEVDKRSLTQEKSRLEGELSEAQNGLKDVKGRFAGEQERTADLGRKNEELAKQLSEAVNERDGVKAVAREALEIADKAALSPEQLNQFDHFKDGVLTLTQDRC
jgi:hypothetical protein